MRRVEAARHLALLPGLLLGACLAAPTAFAQASDPTEACLTDLQAAIGLVERNYAGYADKLARYGSQVLAQAEHAASERIHQAHGAECLQQLNDWIAVFQDGHVRIAPAQPAQPPGPRLPSPERSPRFELLSQHTALIRIPSFDISHEAALDELIARERAAITARPYLIVDVRGNGGGSDRTYEELARLLYSGPVQSRGVDVLATPENIAAWERALPELPEPARPGFAARIALMRAHVGQFFPLVGDGEITFDEVLPWPRRVAVLVDASCASSCEEFLLLARASSKVRLFGVPSAGVLDYANVRPHPLPSGRVLELATTRSRRLPDQPVDGIGVLPDVALDPARFDDGAERAHVLLEVLLQLD